MNMSGSKTILLIFIAFFALGLSGLTCVNAASDRLVLTGSSTVAPLVGEMARRFETVNPGVRIDVQTGGTSRGINDTRNGTADIGMVSRALKPDETDLHAFAIALDGISIILHANNRVTTLSKQQIIDIYTGKITNWRSVDGADARITVVNKAEGRSTLELFLHYLELKNSQIKPHAIIGDNPQGIKTVAGNPNAIGYVSIGAAEYEIKRGVPIKLLPLDGVDATIDNVRNGTFPLSRPLNLITSRKPGRLARRFIEFSRSRQTHDLVEAQYFVPVRTD
ncbi:LysR substrate-binding protein [Nitrosomonas mobilis]|uniref:LysR substrate-binding protein n=2 Tax=Nitrosomonas mobilis TaxID=51642 RepID=A0A1G5SJY4_9PROT|nr:LysR substrate-binding protein [Nitrosomonas mobilis]